MSPWFPHLKDISFVLTSLAILLADQRRSLFDGHVAGSPLVVLFSSEAGDSP